jgi:hypothetical protein
MKDISPRLISSVATERPGSLAPRSVKSVMSVILHLYPHAAQGTLFTNQKARARGGRKPKTRG